MQIVVVVMRTLFLSTLSLRRATNINSSVNTADQISIHALLAESDQQRVEQSRGNKNFYPRSPCGERLVGDVWACRWPDISIHALLAESDFKTKHPTNPKNHFYPRSPCGERPPIKAYSIIVGNISIHALLAESDYLCSVQPSAVVVFLSTLSLRRATLNEQEAKSKLLISIHALLAESDSTALA